MRLDTRSGILGVLMGCALLLGAWQPATAMSFAPVSQDRTVSASSDCDSGGVVATGFEDFDASITSLPPSPDIASCGEGDGAASQVSTLRTGRIFLDGEGFGDGLGEGKSRFEYVFAVSEVTEIAFLGLVEGRRGGDAVVSLSPLGEAPIFEVAAISFTPEELVQFIGRTQLDPGSYELVAEANGRGSAGIGRYDFVLSPEPGTGALLALGLACLAARRRAS